MTNKEKKNILNLINKLIKSINKDQKTLTKTSMLLTLKKNESNISERIYINSIILAYNEVNNDFTHIIEYLKHIINLINSNNIEDNNLEEIIILVNNYYQECTEYLIIIDYYTSKDITKFPDITLDSYTHEENINKKLSLNKQK